MDSEHFQHFQDVIAYMDDSWNPSMWEANEFHILPEFPDLQTNENPAGTPIKFEDYEKVDDFEHQREHIILYQSPEKNPELDYLNYPNPEYSYPVFQPEPMAKETQVPESYFPSQQTPMPIQMERPFHQYEYEVRDTPSTSSAASSKTDKSAASGRAYRTAKAQDRQCPMCLQTSTTQWRKLDGKFYCNACHRYAKLHGVDAKRPDKLIHRPTQKRRRSATSKACS